MSKLLKFSDSGNPTHLAVRVDEVVAVLKSGNSLSVNECDASEVINRWEKLLIKNGTK